MVISKGIVDKSSLEPCTQEEADTRIFLHVDNASSSGITKVLIRTVDTDVAVIAISLFEKLNLLELWL